MAHLIIPSGFLQDRYAGMSINLSSYAEDFSENLDLRSETVTGPDKGRVGVIMQNWAADGNKEFAFHDIFYGHVYIVVETDFYYGKTIETGLVAYPVSYDVEIWNAYLTQPVTLNSLVWTEGEGVTTSGLTVPVTIGELLSDLFSVTISEQGPVTIGASGLFSFDIGNDYLLITGTRGLPLIIPPDRDGYAEVRWWSTDIFRSQDGTEQRNSLMDVAKRGVESVISTDEELEVHRLESLMMVGSKYQILQPLWMSKTVLTQATDGTTTIYVDTTNREFVVADFVLLRVSDLHYDIKQIITVAATYITVDKAPGSFAAGTAIVPMIKATPEMLTTWVGRNKRFQRFQVKSKEL